MRLSQNLRAASVSGKAVRHFETTLLYLSVLGFAFMAGVYLLSV